MATGRFPKHHSTSRVSTTQAFVRAIQRTAPAVATSAAPCGCGGCGGCGSSKPTPKRKFNHATPIGLIVGPGPRGEPRGIYQRIPQRVGTTPNIQYSPPIVPGGDPGTPGGTPGGGVPGLCTRMHPPQCDACPEGNCWEVFAGVGGFGEASYTYFCTDDTWSPGEIRARAVSVCSTTGGTPALCRDFADRGTLYRPAGCGARCGSDRRSQASSYPDEWSRRVRDADVWRGRCF